VLQPLLYGGRVMFAVRNNIRSVTRTDLNIDCELRSCTIKILLCLQEGLVLQPLLYGGRVMFAVRNNIRSVTRTDLNIDCELRSVQLTLQEKEMLVGIFYIVHLHHSYSMSMAVA